MSTYEISKSSLLSLKAEILRKQQELCKAKNENEIKIKVIKKNIPLELKNKGVESRIEADRLTDDDIDVLKQSRSQLEFKSMLYDRLSQGNLSKEQQAINNQYLVRFDKKNISNTFTIPPNDCEDEPDKFPESDSDYYNSDDEHLQDPGEKWVEYVDCLGRTRKCLQKDLDYLKNKDSELQKVVEARKNTENQSLIENEQSEEKCLDTNNVNVHQEDELLSNDMRREMLRQQWEKQEEYLKNKSNIHYQDVLFGEARTHGVGYYGFSKDEEERLKQQESLKKLRQETELKQQKAQELKALREKQLAARIKSAKERKRARLGLPPEEEPKPPQTLTSEKEQKAEKDAQKEAIERLLDEARKKHIRPWDVGKEGVKVHYEMTQEEWVDKKRSERPKEFAPPSTCIGKSETLTKKFDKQNNNHRSRLDKDANTRKNKQLVNNSTSNIYSTDNSEDHLLEHNKSLHNRIDDIVNSDSDNDNKSNGVEIAPPPTYEYYKPSCKVSYQSSPNPINIEASIEAGLKFLRNQAEKKHRIRK